MQHSQHTHDCKFKLNINNIDYVRIWALATILDRFNWSILRFTELERALFFCSNWNNNGQNAKVTMLESEDNGQLQPEKQSVQIQRLEETQVGDNPTNRVDKVTHPCHQWGWGLLTQKDGLILDMIVCLKNNGSYPDFLYLYNGSRVWAVAPCLSDDIDIINYILIIIYNPKEEKGNALTIRKWS